MLLNGEVPNGEIRQNCVKLILGSEWWADRCSCISFSPYVTVSLKFSPKMLENEQSCHFLGWESERTAPQLFALKLPTAGPPRSLSRGMALT